MEKVKDFRNLVVWQKSHELFLRVVEDVERFPKSSAGRVISDQLLRSCGSISANISEGFDRHQGKEFIHYLIIARGSTSETLNWLIKVCDLGWVDIDSYHKREALIIEIMKMLNKMIGQGLRGVS